jgi:hypothetical protein
MDLIGQMKGAEIPDADKHVVIRSVGDENGYTQVDLDGQNYDVFQRVAIDRMVFIGTTYNGRFLQNGRDIPGPQPILDKCR